MNIVKLNEPATDHDNEESGRRAAQAGGGTCPRRVDSTLMLIATAVSRAEGFSGLDTRCTPEEIEAAHARLVRYLVTEGFEKCTGARVEPYPRHRLPNLDDEGTDTRGDGEENGECAVGGSGSRGVLR